MSSREVPTRITAARIGELLRSLPATSTNQKVARLHLDCCKAIAWIKGGRKAARCRSAERVCNYLNQE